MELKIWKWIFDVVISFHNPAAAGRAHRELLVAATPLRERGLRHSKNSLNWIFYFNSFFSPSPYIQFFT